MKAGLVLALFAITALPAAAAGAGAGIRERIISAALDRLGAPYRFGGSGPEAFDCSGLAQWSYGMAGVRLPRTTAAQRRAGSQVPLADAQPGDLLFFRYAGDEAKPAGLHVAIYLGDHGAVHAPSRGGRVELIDIEDPHWQQRFVEARRALSETSTELATNRASRRR